MFYLITSLLIGALLIVNQKQYWKSNGVLSLRLKREIVIGILCIATSFISIELQ